MKFDPVTLGVGGVIAMAVIGLLGWVLKKGLVGFLDQNKKMVDGALDNMRANTDAIRTNAAAIQANTEATLRHLNGCDVRAALAAKEDEETKKQLDRIEKGVERIHRKGGGGHGDT
jgi:hypothetical protein